MPRPERGFLRSYAPQSTGPNPRAQLGHMPYISFHGTDADNHHPPNEDIMAKKNAPADTGTDTTTDVTGNEDTGTTVDAAANTKTKAAAAVPFEVAMKDGKLVTFSGKRKMLKSAITDSEKGLGVRLDFVNGEFREFYVTEALLHRFAVHGAEQKLGDEIAGVDLVEDCIEAIDELIERLYNGEWTVKREANAMNGASILARALVETSGKSISEVRAFLAPLDAKSKLSLRMNASVAPVVARLEAERDAKKKPKETVDTTDLLAQLSGPAA